MRRILLGMKRIFTLIPLQNYTIFYVIKCPKMRKKNNFDANEQLY